MTEYQQTSGRVPGRPPVVTVFAAFALLVAAQLAGGAAFAALAGGTGLVAGDAAQMTAELQRLAVTTWFFAGSVALNAAFCVLIAAGGARLGGERVAARARLGPGPGVAAAAVAAAGLIGLSQSLSSAHALLDLDVATSLSVMEEIVASSTGLGFVAVLLSAGLLAGVGEELFFRGFLQTRLRQRWGVWPAISITALAFGILHYDPVHSVMAFGMGVFLGWLVERTGSIRPAVAAHVLNNTAWILAAGSYGEPTAFGMELAILAGSLVVLAIATVSFAALTRPAR